MKLYRKTIFFGLIFTMLMAPSEAMAPTLQEQMIDLHSNLNQLKNKLRSLKDGLDTVARRLKGEVDDEKKEEKEEEMPPVKHLPLSKEQSTSLISFLKNVNEQIQDNDTNFKNNLIEKDENCFSTQYPNFLSKEQIADDIKRFEITLKFKEETKIFRLQLDADPTSLTGDDIETLKKIVTEYMETVCREYEDLNLFKDFDDVKENDTVKSPTNIHVYSHPDDFKVFTKAKITEIQNAQSTANRLFIDQDFWYYFINDNDRFPAKDKAAASGRLIDFYLQNLFKDYQDQDADKRDEFIGDIFGKIAGMFGLRTQATIAIYPFVFMNLRTAGFFQCVIDIVLAVIGQKSHSPNYYAYKHLANPTVYQLLRKIKEQQYSSDDLKIIENACNDYRIDNPRNNIRVPNYAGKTTEKNINSGIPYTPQGVRTKMEILGMIYARRTLDTLSSLQTEADIINAIVEDIIPFKKDELKKERAEIDKKIKQIEQQLTDDKKAFEEEIEAIQKEISKKHAELDGIKAGDTSEIEKEITKLEKEKSELKIDIPDINEWFAKETAKVIEPKKYSDKEIDLLAKEEIRQNEYRKRLQTKISKEEKYIPSICEQLNKVVEEIVNKKNILNRNTADSIKTKKVSWDGNWKLEDIFRTIGGICNDYAIYEKKANEANKEKLKTILQNSDTCVHFVLTHKESLQFLTMNSINQNNREKTDLHKIATLIGALCKVPHDAFPDGYEQKITYKTITDLPPLDIKIISAGLNASILTIRMYLLVEAGLNEYCVQNNLDLILKNDEEKKPLLPGQPLIVAAYEEWMQSGAQQGKGKEEKKAIGDKKSKEKQKKEFFDATRAEIVERLEQEKKEYEEKITALKLERESKIAAKQEEAETVFDKAIQAQQERLILEKEKDISSKAKIAEIKISIYQQREKLQALKDAHEKTESSQKTLLTEARKALSEVCEQQDTLRQTLGAMSLATLTAELKKYTKVKK